MPSTIEVAVFLQPEGVDGHGGAGASGRAAQHTRARGVVNIEVFVGGASVPTDEVIQQVIGERGRGATGGAAGDVAPAIVAARVDSSAQIRAGGAQRVEAGELVRLAVAVEVLLLGAAAAQRALPELAQVRVNIAIVVTGSTQGIGERGRATGAVACPGLGAGVAGPHQAVLLVITEVLALAAA